MNTLTAIVLLCASHVSLTTTDAVKIAATYEAPAKVTAQTPAAILVPMYLRKRGDWAAFGRDAAKGGVATLAIDPRGHGESANPTGRAASTWGGREWMGVLKDIAAARAWLVQKGYAPGRIVIAGASIGASLSLEYAVSDKAVAGVALLSVSTNLTGRTPEANIGRLTRRPVFLACSEDDRPFAATSVRMAGAIGARATLQRYTRAGHGTDMFGREDRPGDLTRALVAWTLKVTRAAKGGRPTGATGGASAPKKAAVLAPGKSHRVTLTRRSELSTPAEMTRRFGWTAAQLQRAGHRDYTLADESFQVYVPRGHDPKVAHGLLVWIDAGNDGEVPATWRAELDRSKLIAVGPNRAGNDRLVPVRLGLAIDAVHALSRRFKVDPKRIYVAGFSGGGRTASMAAWGFADVFTGGGLACAGASYFRAVPVQSAGGSIRPAFRAPSAALQDLARTARRLVLWTGGADSNTPVVRAQHAAMRAHGFTNVMLQVAPGVGHERPDAAQLRAAIRTLQTPVERATAPAR